MISWYSSVSNLYSVRSSQHIWRLWWNSTSNSRQFKGRILFSNLSWTDIEMLIIMMLKKSMLRNGSFWQHGCQARAKSRCMEALHCSIHSDVVLYQVLLVDFCCLWYSCAYIFNKYFMHFTITMVSTSRLGDVLLHYSDKHEAFSQGDFMCHLAIPLTFTFSRCFCPKRLKMSFFVG